jgi:hypothetical protein
VESVSPRERKKLGYTVVQEVRCGHLIVAVQVQFEPTLWGICRGQIDVKADFLFRYLFYKISFFQFPILLCRRYWCMRYAWPARWQIRFSVGTQHLDKIIERKFDYRTKFRGKCLKILFSPGLKSLQCYQHEYRTILHQCKSINWGSEIYNFSYFSGKCIINSMYVTEYATSYELWAVLVAFKAPIKQKVIWFHKSFGSDRSGTQEVISLRHYFYYSMIVPTFSTWSYHVTRKVTSYFMCYWKIFVGK